MDKRFNSKEEEIIFYKISDGLDSIDFDQWSNIFIIKSNHKYISTFI